MFIGYNTRVLTLKEKREGVTSLICLLSLRLRGLACIRASTLQGKVGLLRPLTAGPSDQLGAIAAHILADTLTLLK